MQALIGLVEAAHRGLDRIGTWLPQLALRALVGWEFFEAGLEKLGGENWFADVADKFPFPFDLLPPAASWFLATWTEVLGGICIWLGLATRFWAAGLVILSIVAIAGVHWPADWSSLSELWKGYAITDRGYGNFKLPLLLIAMLLPLLFTGAGRLSLDELIRRRF
jgi:putative oxidoreductase